MNILPLTSSPLTLLNHRPFAYVRDVSPSQDNDVYFTPPTKQHVTRLYFVFRAFTHVHDPYHSSDGFYKINIEKKVGKRSTRCTNHRSSSTTERDPVRALYHSTNPNCPTSICTRCPSWWIECDIRGWYLYASHGWLWEYRLVLFNLSDSFRFLKDPRFYFIRRGLLFFKCYVDYFIFKDRPTDFIIRCKLNRFF